MAGYRGSHSKGIKAKTRAYQNLQVIEGPNELWDRVCEIGKETWIVNYLNIGRRSKNQKVNLFNFTFKN